MYFGVVCSVGLAVFGLEVATGVPGLGDARSAFWLISGLIFLGEFVTIPVSRKELDEITVSTTFSFALLLAFGAGPAIIAQGAASVVSDVVHGKRAWTTIFNLAQYALSLAAAGVVYERLGGGGPISSQDLWPAVAAALVFFLLNTIVTSCGIGLRGDDPIVGHIIRDVRFDAHTGPALLALSPVVVVAAERSLWLVPLAASPAAAVWWAMKLALENQRMAERLRDSLEHMTNLNRVKDDFVAVVSHELRTPLTSIQGYVKTLLQLSPVLEDEQRRTFLEAADRQADRLRRLIEQLLVVGRLESQAEPLATSRVSLSLLVALVVDELRPRANGHVFDIRLDPDAGEIMTDEAKVHQILSNLVENALKYSPPDTRVTVSSGPAVHGVVLSVGDEGPGIPAEAQDKIFDRFFQVDSSTTRTVGGTGLGLYICRKMAETAGARLWLARSDDTGSEFCLFLPERPSVDEGEKDPSDVVGPSAQSITARV